MAEEDAFHRRFLAERTKWRSSRPGSYQYELNQWASWTSWRGTINVTGSDVTSFDTIERFPPEFGNPEIPSIDRLFERLADAIAANAHQITVTWHPTLGYPQNAYIDLEEFLADEERGWTINSFTASP